jgi:hypothetical protein
MTKRTTPTATFPRCKGREITASFDGGEITSDAGALLLRQLDREMGPTRAIARRLDDARASGGMRTSTIIMPCARRSLWRHSPGCGNANCCL